MRIIRIIVESFPFAGVRILELVLAFCVALEHALFFPLH